MVALGREISAAGRRASEVDAQSAVTLSAPAFILFQRNEAFVRRAV